MYEIIRYRLDFSSYQKLDTDPIISYLFIFLSGRYEGQWTSGVVSIAKI